MSEPISQTLTMEEPVQFIGMLKRVQGPQKGDVVMAYPMVDAYKYELSADQKTLTLTLSLSDEEPPDDWVKDVAFQNELTVAPSMPSIDWKFKELKL